MQRAIGSTLTSFGTPPRSNFDIIISMSEEHDLTTAPIATLIRRISLPVMVGFFFNTMFNVVDTYFGGKISTDALAALSLSFPVFFLIIIFDSGLSTGATTVIANALGAGDKPKAQKLVAQSLSLGVIIAIVLTIFGPKAVPTLFTLLGASGNYLALAVDYIDIIFYGSIFFILESNFTAALQARGNTSIYRNFLIAGFFLNVLLDPWFLYGGFGVPAMGFKGVAVATVLIQALGALYLFIKVKQYGLVSKDTWREMIPDFKYYGEILKQAGPASINMVTVGAGIFVITYYINQFGQDAVAAYGIATRVEQIILLPTIGLTIACLTIIGQNNGAKKIDRIRETLLLCLKYGIWIMVLGGALIFALSRPIMSFFTDNAAVIASGAHYLKIAALLTVAYAILFICVSALQGMKRPMYAVWIGIFRQLVAPVAVFTLLIHYFNLGIDGIWWGIFLVNWFAAIVTIIYTKRVLKNHQA